jgi:mRNA-degrading endonuclease RelE of RelBE toxin-antitoxin system
MKFVANASFWQALNALPSAIQSLAKKNFELLKENPAHPSLHLKKVGKYWSVRVGRRYRALGVEIEDGVLWFWIGTHAEYDRLLETR